MASYERVIKFEREKPQGVIRLVESNGFYRAYNQSAYYFHQVIAQHKVTRKFVKNINQEIVYVGFPVDKLLERIGDRSHKKTEFGYDVELAAGELPDETAYDEWRATVPTEPASRGDANSLSASGDELCRAVCERIRTYPMEKSLFCAKDGCGLPIGNLSSQLFSNIYLGMLDDFVKRELKVRHYGRYVDDVFIVGESKEYLKSVIEPIRAFLRERLQLELSENKTRICDARQGVEFLGAFIKPFRTYVASRSLRRIRKHLHAATPRMCAQRAQSVVNSSLGALSHYDSFCVRNLLVAKSQLVDFGLVSQDWLRFYPNALDWRLCTLRNLKKGAKK